MKIPEKLMDFLDMKNRNSENFSIEEISDYIKLNSIRIGNIRSFLWKLVQDGLIKKIDNERYSSLFSYDTILDEIRSNF